MRGAIDETSRRRKKQVEYNTTHGITPRGVVKALKEIIDGVHAEPRGLATGTRRESLQAMEGDAEYTSLAPGALAKLLTRLEKQMYTHARNLEFEQAAALRDKIGLLRERNFRLIGGNTGD
jgi:excinuclease ABC subunit B